MICKRSKITNYRDKTHLTFNLLHFSKCPVHRYSCRVVFLRRKEKFNCLGQHNFASGEHHDHLVTFRFYLDEF